MQSQEKKNKKLRNVKWLVGSIGQKWKELAKADVLLHFATVGRRINFQILIKLSTLM